MEEKNITLIAIVAIVAVVALVALVLYDGGGEHRHQAKFVKYDSSDNPEEPDANIVGDLVKRRIRR